MKRDANSFHEHGVNRIAGCFPLALFMILLACMFDALPTMAFPADIGQQEGYKKLRYEEDYSYLRSNAQKADLFDPLKFISLTHDKETYLSLGGEARLCYEFTHNPEWGQAPQDENGVFLQRYLLHGDLHVGRGVRFFGQLVSALANGREGGPSPVDENRLALQQLFVDLDFHPFSNRRLILRPGRQEIAFGSGRLVDVREGPNVRRRFDAVRGILDVSDWSFNALAGRPVQEEPGAFDDHTDSNRGLWGIYAVRKVSLVGTGGIDAYYLGIVDDEGNYEQGVEREIRHSIGTRLWGENGGWDYNFELVYQFGKFGDGHIRAWTIASDTGFTWKGARFKPRLGLRADIASGDRNTKDRDLETFNPLFPRGNYFSEISTLGPKNFFDIHPFLTLNPTDELSVTGDLNFFWRQSLDDGIYSPNGRLLRASGDSEARFVAATLSLTAEWRINRHSAVTAIYAYSLAGEFLRDTGQDEPISFIEVTFRFLF